MREEETTPAEAGGARLGTARQGDSSQTTKKPTVAERALRGALWVAVGYGGAQILRLAGNLILVRMLYKEAFGLMALVSVFQHGLGLLSDFGIGPGVIQNSRGDEARFLNTAWTIQATRGTVLWLISCVGGPIFARFYGEPLLAYVIPVSSLILLISGFSSTKVYTQNRHLAMRRLELMRVVCQIVSIIVMVVWAWLSPTVWALVAGGIAGSLLRTILTHAVLPGRRNRFQFEPQAAEALFRFGRWVFLSTLLTFLTGQADRLVFGKLIPLDVLGVYSIALLLVSTPSLALEHLGRQIMFPFYSRVKSTTHDLDGVFRRTRMPLVVLGGWTFAGLMAGGPTAVGLLYEAPYYDAGWMVQLLAAGAWFGVLDSVNSSVLLARDHTHWLAAAGLGKLLGMAVFIFVGFRWAAFPGALAGLACASTIRYLVSLAGTYRIGLGTARQDLLSTGVVALSAFVGRHFASAVHQPDVWPMVEAAVVFVAVTTFWVPAAVPMVKRLRSRERRADSGQQMSSEECDTHAS